MRNFRYKKCMSIGIMAIFCMTLYGCSDTSESVEAVQNEQVHDENTAADMVKESEDLKEIQDVEESTDESKDISAADDSENAEDVEAEIISDKEETDSDISKVMVLYDEILKKIVSGEEMISGDGDEYDYSHASDPGYALYDIDGDSIPELFITGEKDSNWHSYTIYSVKDDEVIKNRTINGYIPDDDTWIFGYDFLIAAYEYDIDTGFTQKWRIEYPFEDEESIMITYGNQVDKEEISAAEVDELLSKEILEPVGIEWMPLNHEISLIGEVSPTADESAGDITVEDVVWNNGSEEYVFPAENDTEFTFKMSNGKEQVISANYDPMITGKEMVDIDNDGEDEYVIYAYYGNTTGEFEFPYIFKCVDGTVMQLFPTKDIPKLAEPTWVGMTRGDLTNTSLTTVENDGSQKNALEVSLLEKNDGEVAEVYHEILIYNNDHWEEFK